MSVKRSLVILFHVFILVLIIDFQISKFQIKYFQKCVHRQEIKHLVNCVLKQFTKLLNNIDLVSLNKLNI